MSISEVRKDIKSYQKKITEKKSELREKKKKLENLIDFLEEYKLRSDRINENIYYREQYIKNCSLDESRFRVYKVYREQMMDMLTGVEMQNRLAEIEDGESIINRYILTTEQEIEDLKRQIQNYESILSDLEYELERLLSEEDDY